MQLNISAASRHRATELLTSFTIPATAIAAGAVIYRVVRDLRTCRFVTERLLVVAVEPGRVAVAERVGAPTVWLRVRDGRVTAADAGDGSTLPNRVPIAVLHPTDRRIALFELENARDDAADAAAEIAEAAARDPRRLRSAEVAAWAWQLERAAARLERAESATAEN